MAFLSTPSLSLLQQHKLLMRLYIFVVSSLMLLLSSALVCAIELPFLSKHPPFELRLSGELTAQQEKQLLEVLKKELDRQREENQHLRHAEDENQLTRIETGIIRKTLKSQGFYRSFVRAVITTPSQTVLNKLTNSLNTNEKNLLLIYEINPGPEYLVSEVNVYFPDIIDKKLTQPLHELKGQSLKASLLLDTLNDLKQAIKTHYCFYQIAVDYDVRIKHKDASAIIDVSMAPSDQIKFGDIQLSGLESLEEPYVRTLLKFKAGDCFKQTKLDETRLAMLGSNLISSVDIKQTLEKDRLSSDFIISERHHRTVNAGIGFNTDEGMYLSAGWQHRNLLGEGERLQIDSHLSQSRQKVDSEFFIPSFFAPNKSLTLYGLAQNEELDAYEATSVKAGAKVGFKQSRYLSYSLGAELKYSDVTDIEAGNMDETFHLLSFPFLIEWDKTNSLLDPTEGYLISSEFRPYIDILDTDVKFFKSLLSISAYHTFDAMLQPTLAGRYSLGSITGEAVNSIPADERFYVGGGGSVRGYPYQSLSLIQDDDPQGGASFQQVNTELRIRFLENWGTAIFAGGGYAFPDATPNFNQTLLWAAGIGLRYYTSFAPFRLDVAFPLNKREDYDDDFQLYISIGQAF